MTDERRRNLVLFGGAAAVAGALWAGPRLYRTVFGPEFDFEPVQGLPDFRRIARPDLSAGSPVLLGLGGDTPAPRPVAPGVLRSDPCHFLFGNAPPIPGTVPVAYFSDIRCPYCREMTKVLRDLEEGEPPAIRIAWHELPLLGEGSVLAARAAIAAGMQKMSGAWHERVTGTPLVPTRGYISDVAGEIGLDPAKLLVDMDLPEVDRTLAISRGLADLFGFVGTPAMVIGRTAVLGRIGRFDLGRLLALEIAGEADAPCT